MRRDPTRTCIACRGEGSRDELIRLVQSPDGAVVVDAKGNLPGRGAWIHPSRACLEEAERRPGVLARAFKGRVEAPELASAVRGVVERATLDALSLAAAAGALAGGRDVLERALREGRVRALAVASDASERTVEALRAAADPEVETTVLPLTREELGRRIGRGSRAALGVLPSRAADPLVRQLRRLRALG